MIADDDDSEVVRAYKTLLKRKDQELLENRDRVRGRLVSMVGHVKEVCCPNPCDR